MGVYLSMLGNEKPDPANNIRPDENYARELMQLFSIGLVELNIDGTEALDTDTNGQPIPTYDQSKSSKALHTYLPVGPTSGSPFNFAVRVASLFRPASTPQWRCGSDLPRCGLKRRC